MFHSRLWKAFPAIADEKPCGGGHRHHDSEDEYIGHLSERLQDASFKSGLVGRTEDATQRCGAVGR